MKLNNLIMKGFKPNNVQSLNKRLIFEEESRNEKRLQAALDELCYDYEIIGRRPETYGNKSYMQSGLIHRFNCVLDFINRMHFFRI